MIEGPLTLPSSVAEDLTVMSGLVASRLTEIAGGGCGACAATGRSENITWIPLTTTARHTQATVGRVISTSLTRDSDMGSGIRDIRDLGSGIWDLDQFAGATSAGDSLFHSITRTGRVAGRMHRFREQSPGLLAG